MTTIANQTFDEERALYHLEDALVTGCTFAGPADGESALKESRRVTVQDCSFSLRYPFWHTRDFAILRCTLDSLTRAPLWYAEQGRVEDSTINGTKCLRECSGIALTRVTAESDEFGWRCREIDMRECEVTSSYFFFETRDSRLDGFTLHGKYSFQYTENVTVSGAKLDTKDAFWHAKNVTVRDAEVRGEYLGWYSDGLTLINCHISGTQPLCYCKNLRLVNCTMEGTDLAFEYSDVQAEIIGGIDSVKNPRSGRIIADSIGEIICEGAVMETSCAVELRG